MTLFPMIHLVNVFAGTWFALTTLVYHKFPERRIRPEEGRQLQGPKFVWRVALNGILSVSMVYGWAYLLQDYIFYTEMKAWWRVPVEMLAILAVYDVLYYLLHRFPFHQWGWLKRVHAVHHMAKFPIAVDSLFLHPVENFAGLALLNFCIWIVGPVHIYSFALCYFVYSLLNIVVHGGIVLPFPMNYFTLLARKHDKHHATMTGGNFASITPLPDILFGTAE